MKNSILIILALFLGVAVSAQVPQSFRFQAVARDNSGNILASQRGNRQQGPVIQGSCSKEILND